MTSQPTITAAYTVCLCGTTHVTNYANQDGSMRQHVRSDLRAKPRQQIVGDGAKCEGRNYCDQRAS